MATEDELMENGWRKIWAWVNSTELIYVIIGGAAGGFFDADSQKISGF